MLIISGYNKKGKGAKGIMRRAIAGALITSYIIAFSIFMFQNFELVQQSMLDTTNIPDVTTMDPVDVKEYMLLQNQTASIGLLKMEFSNSILVNFTNVIMVVIVFYFGSKGVLQYLKDRQPGSSTSSGAQKLHNAAAAELEKIRGELKEAEKDLSKAEKDLAKDPNDKEKQQKVKDAQKKVKDLKEKEAKAAKVVKDLEDTKDSSKIIQELDYNIKKSASPLIVGFYLKGPTIAHRKRWHFGDNSAPIINNNLVQNHTYRKVGEHTMWVEIINNADEVIEKSDEHKFTVTEKVEKFNFDQWEGVIAEGDDVGFSLGGQIRGEDKIKWVWGDGKESKKETNPHHTYENAGKYDEGKVSVGGVEREFGVLVLPDRVKHMAGHIEIVDVTERDGEFPTKEKLTFQVQVTGGRPKYKVKWNFGDGKTGKDKQTEHKYEESGNYHVSCEVIDKNGLTLSFDKNVSIVKKD